ncbi:hypothetical protein BUALT_Bualt03G0173300 [Buddleja alternifolia]|uniref:Uncharacterized protein n=1 Tax=Buddleja alternifolia TaxID=168488 RepID=A0AAV6Y1D7_9LAMI|nr:hypothetical protein BUALT_Bualt03G0173300 [Buddleja alternifolia]
MASIVVENWEYVDNRDDPENFELSQINQNFLMSLLDETQIDVCDDERLTSVIRSLEAEIDSNSEHYAIDDIAMGNTLVDCQSSNNGFNGHDCSMMPHDNLDLHWMDMDIIPSSPNDGIYMDHHGQGMCGVTEYYSQLCYEIPLQGQDYDFLWYETNVNVIE